MHKAFSLPRESSHWQYKFPLPVKVVPTTRRIEILLPGVCTAIEEMKKKLPENFLQLHFTLIVQFTKGYGSSEQSGRTVTFTTEDMQKKKKKNDVKARTTLLLSLPDEHQLRFSKYKTTKELWAAILKTFGGNEATKKRKKNLLKQQYENFKAEGTKTLE
nr:ribonuclease H-like domain-containing protein [Tanacetum cinerariifolium]